LFENSTRPPSRANNVKSFPNPTFSPEAYNEVNAIDKHYKSNGKRSRIFIGSQATFQNFLDNRTNSSIIHVATHNIVDFNSPFLSHLLLFFEDTSPNKFDNIMFLPLVPYIGLKASLVILDGCETGNGKLLGSEGLLSMAHAISSNDVSSVVFSIWNISDSLAKKFVTRFIHYFSQDNNIDQAMRKVKIEMINSNYSHPYYWSGIMAYKNYF
jgi:CHAT domain-containing protein